METMTDTPITAELTAGLIARLVAADHEYREARKSHREVARELRHEIDTGNIWKQIPLFVAGTDAVRRVAEADETRWSIRNKIARLAPGAVAVKLADPIDDARLLFTLDELKVVSDEDPALIVSLRSA